MIALKRRTMLKSLKRKPLLTSLLIISLYALWFLVPMIFKDMDPNAKGIAGIAKAIKEVKAELITGSVLVLFLTILGWWKNIGFVRIKKGGVKFLLPILILALIILNVAWVMDESNKWFLGFNSPQQLLLLVVTMLMLGFVEEGLFRGVLFYGLSTKLTPLYTVTISAFIFGLFHFVNIFTGAEVIATVYQAIHAFAMGFLYASLRLKIGAIWPLMIMHALWDFSLFTIQSSVKIKGSEDISLGSGLAVALPALTYGLFVYWRWSKENSSKNTISFSTFR
jgi:membrane protease YdiL (CAAX protease family)